MREFNVMLLAAIHVTRSIDSTVFVSLFASPNRAKKDERTMKRVKCPPAGSIVHDNIRLHTVPVSFDNERCCFPLRWKITCRQLYVNCLVLFHSCQIERSGQVRLNPFACSQNATLSENSVRLASMPGER